MDNATTSQRHEADKHVSQQRRMTVHERVISLSQQGYNQGEIATELGMSRKKVRQLLQGPPHPPVYKSRPTKLTPYTSYLKHRFTEEACDNSLQLYREIRTLGYEGCRSVVTNYVTQLRKPSRGESDDRKKAKQTTQTAYGQHSCPWPTAVVLPSRLSSASRRNSKHNSTGSVRMTQDLSSSITLLRLSFTCFMSRLIQD